MDDLRRMQLTIFTEIIRGDRPIEDFGTFVIDWKSQGGDILLKEANELRVLQKRIYAEVGIL